MTIFNDRYNRNVEKYLSKLHRPFTECSDYRNGVCDKDNTVCSFVHLSSDETIADFTVKYDKWYNRYHKAEFLKKEKKLDKLLKSQERESYKLDCCIEDLRLVIKYNENVNILLKKKVDGILLAWNTGKTIDGSESSTNELPGDFVDFYNKTFGTDYVLVLKKQLTEDTAELQVLKEVVELLSTKLANVGTKLANAVGYNGY